MENLSKLSDTLKELLIIRGLNENLLAEKTGITVSCISVYVRGRQAPYVDTIIKLADFFNCSVDYLLGRTDELVEKNYKPCPPFAPRFNELLELKKCTNYKSFSDCKISKSSFYEWRRGKSLPTTDNLVKIADKLGYSVDYILGRES